MPVPVNGYGEHLRPANRGQAKTITNQPYAPIQQPADEGQALEIEMYVGESRVFPSPGVARIAVGNGAILNAAALDGKEVILFANAPGTSSLFVWNKDGRHQRVKINIARGDTGRYAREIAAFLSAIPRAKASIIGENVIVEGDNLTDADLARIDLLSKRYPQIVNFTNPLGFETMVMLDVKVAEFPTTELRELGIRWNTTGGGAIGGIWSPFRRGIAGDYQINIQTPDGRAVPPIVSPGGVGNLVVPSGLNILSALNLGLNATLNALAQQGKTTMLAEPQLSARNGSKATFLAGGEYPYPIATRDGIAVQFKPYGIKLDIQPKVDASGNVRATIEAEVSSIDLSVSSPYGPALSTRKTGTEFNVHSGETIVLSGLIHREAGTSVDKVPGLGDIPILGALFRSERFQNKETELVVFVTPTVVTPSSPGLVDRLQKTDERLEQRLGPPPYLSNPLQPGRDFSRPDLPDSAPPGRAPAVHSSASAATAPGAAIQDNALEPLTSAAAAQPAPRQASAAAAPRTFREVAPTEGKPLSLGDLPLRSQYLVTAKRLPLLLTPDVNAQVARFVAEGEVVDGLATAPRGAWTAVDYQGQRGWLSTPWIQSATDAR